LGVTELVDADASGASTAQLAQEDLKIEAGLTGLPLLLFPKDAKKPSAARC
jgi:hypothetical protein